MASATVRRTLVWGCWDPLDDVIAVPDSGEAYGEKPVADAISDLFWQRIRLITCVWSGIRTPCTLGMVNGRSSPTQEIALLMRCDLLLFFSTRKALLLVQCVRASKVERRLFPREIRARAKGFA